MSSSATIASLFSGVSSEDAAKIMAHLSSQNPTAMSELDDIVCQACDERATRDSLVGFAFRGYLNGTVSSYEAVINSSVDNWKVDSTTAEEMYQEINTQALLYNRCGMVDDEINTLKVLLPMCKQPDRVSDIESRLDAARARLAGRAGASRCALDSCAKWEVPPAKFELCRDCALARYCSDACKKAHWKVHKSLCRAATAAQGASQPV